MSEVRRNDIMASVSHLPYNMASFFLALHDGNLAFADTLLYREALRLKRIDGACCYPMPKDEWAFLRAYAVKENIPTDFFVEAPYGFAVEFLRVATFEARFVKRVNAWQVALREGRNQ